MILALDVGNTTIVIGCIDRDNVYFVGRLNTDLDKTEDEYAISFQYILELYGINKDKIDGGIISSVVPPLIQIHRRAVAKVIGKKPLVVGPDIKTGLHIDIDQPRQLGSDLIVDAVAALDQYEAPLIIFDLGTATTVSVIDQNKTYIGGLIYPGLQISVEALSNRTSQLPHISLESSEKVIGRNTIDSMKSGLINGSAAMIDGLIDRIEEELGISATVLATGGLSSFIVPYCKKNIICDNNLLLKGLFFLYEKNKEFL